MSLALTFLLVMILAFVAKVIELLGDLLSIVRVGSFFTYDLFFLASRRREEMGGSSSLLLSKSLRVLISFYFFYVNSSTVS